MATHFTAIRGQAMAIDARTSAPTNPLSGQIYFDTATGNLYVYDGTKWNVTTGTTTSTSSSSTSTSTTLSTSTSISTTSLSTTTTSISTSSTSTSTTLL